MDSKLRKLRIWAITATILFFLATVAALWQWNRNRLLSADSADSAEQVELLTQEKTLLDAQLDSLNLSYTALRSENDSLQGAVAKAEHIVSGQAAQIQQARNTARTAKELRVQVEALQKAKTELETVMTLLRSENEQLKAENARLAGENEQLRGEKESLTGQVSDLSQKLEDQIRKTQSAKFKATSFRVEVEKRGDKLTTRAKKVREISVSFDLADVPENYRGPQKLYLVITDEHGVPVSGLNPVKATVEAPTGAIPIIAQQVKNIILTNTQRLSFVHKLDERLRSGSYVAAIYGEKGLLGVSSFRLS